MTNVHVCSVVCMYASNLARTRVCLQIYFSIYMNVEINIK